MLPDKEFIHRNSMAIYTLLAKLKKCTFAEIQKVCKLDNVGTCLSLIELIRTERIEQVYTPEGVWYVLAK